MEDHISAPINVVFQPQQQIKTQKTVQNAQNRLNKYNSQPKFTSYKQQILKIPKVKQILNKDRFVYNQDIEKRLQLIGSVKSDNFEQVQMNQLVDLRKQVTKKTKRHKTNFKIPLTRQNIQSLNNLIVKHIGHNQIYKNEQTVFLKQYTQNAPFDLEQLKFMDKLDKVKSKFSQKYPQLNQRVLSKNKLTLQNVILNRNIKREMKLDNKKKQKQHSINVLNSLQPQQKNKVKSKKQNS